MTSEVASIPAAAPPPVPASGGASRARHWEMLWISIVVILLALVLRTDGQRVALPGLPRLPLPEVCGSRAWFGVSCPGCGLTRSFVFLAHGRWSEAWQMHRLGWLLALMTAVQIPYRLWCLKRGNLLTRRQGSIVAWVLIAALLANWVLEMLAV